MNYTQIKRHKFKISKNYASKYERFETYCDYLKMWDDKIKCLDLVNFLKNLLWNKQNLLVFPNDLSLFNFYQQYKVGETLNMCSFNKI